MSIHRTWRQGDPKSAPGLASAIAAQDPDVVVIQHQPALLPWASFPDILLTRSTSTRAVVLALHNTRHILDIAPQEREAALHAMRQVARVLVHTLADLNFLNGLGVVDNVTLMPHGAPPRPPARLARTLSPGDEVIVGCYGFFLPGKGIAALIEALAALRETWPLAILRLVNAQYDTPESAYEIASCRALAEERGVPVEWQTEFLPHEQSHALLAGCDVVALPYELSKESSSAALRSALGAGSVIAVTPLELFDEAGDAVFRFSAGDPASIAQGLSHLLADEGLRTRLRDAAGQWLDDRSWNDISARLLGMLTGLARPA
jgi:glycosyltransferase involved in cell wall biosynthesis